MTVPTRFRRNSDIPAILVLHYADLAVEDVQVAQGFRYTRPLRTILDLIEADSVEHTFQRQALRQAFHRGLIRRSKVNSVRLSARAQKVFESLLRQVA
jgi:hypothetical protein